MTATVVYRLPDTDHYVRIRSRHEPLRLSSCEELNGQQGFVFSPFAVSEDTPLLLIRPDEVEVLPFRPSGNDTVSVEKVLFDREEYHKDFQCFHTELLNRHFQKIVLSRHVDVKCCERPSPMRLFVKACTLYPHQFICLISMQQSGTWLMATPEVLIEKQTGSPAWHTMALAGTMCEDGPWSEKDCREQQYVADYIAQHLANHAIEVRRSQPYTRMAAHLYHRCTDFHFILKDDRYIGNIISSLHPTPAVCGIPKRETQDFILQHESHDRKYYSGFCGPLQMDDATHLYVSLRCMLLMEQNCRLYAGGGLLDNSDETREWRETEYKLNTMLDVLR